MRRNAAIRLVLAALVTSVLAACADLPTSPKTPSSARFDGTTSAPAASSVPTVTMDSVARSSTQGTQI